MGFVRPRTKTAPGESKKATKLRRLTTSELGQYIETTLMTASDKYDTWRHTPSYENLADLYTQLEAAQLAVSALMDRETPGVPL